MKEFFVEVGSEKCTIHMSNVYHKNQNYPGNGGNFCGVAKVILKYKNDKKCNKWRRENKDTISFCRIYPGRI